MQRAVKG